MSDFPIELKFTTDLISIPVTIDDTQYTLNEATGAQAGEYRNAVTQSMKLKGGKLAAFGDVVKPEFLLVSLCLIDSSGKHPSIEEVSKWKYSITKSIYDTARKISGLEDAEDEEAEGNESTNSEDGSD
jgi:hypothetical protein